jgi:hypothetical protein
VLVQTGLLEPTALQVTGATAGGRGRITATLFCDEGEAVLFALSVNQGELVTRE